MFYFIFALYFIFEGVLRPPLTAEHAEGPQFGHPIDRINVVIGPIAFLALKKILSIYENICIVSQ